MNLRNQTSPKLDEGLKCKQVDSYLGFSEQQESAPYFPFSVWLVGGLESAIRRTLPNKTWEFLENLKASLGGLMGMLKGGGDPPKARTSESL